MKLPQLVSTGKETETPAALAEMRREVPTSVREFIVIAFRNLLFVMLIVLALERLIPFKDSNWVSVMRIEDAVVSPPKPRDVKTGSVVIERPPTLERDGKLKAFN